MSRKRVVIVLDLESHENKHENGESENLVEIPSHNEISKKCHFVEKCIQIDIEKLETEQFISYISDSKYGVIIPMEDDYSTWLSKNKENVEKTQSKVNDCPDPEKIIPVVLFHFTSLLSLTVMHPAGQALAHRPQPTHLPSSTAA